MYRAIRSICLLLGAGLAVGTPAQAAPLAETTIQGLRISVATAGDVPLKAGEAQEVTIAFHDAATGAPVPGLTPMGWFDRRKENAPSCPARIGAFVQGGLTTRAEADLNAWRIVTMNEDATLAVIDPVDGLSRTKLEHLVELGNPGYDWRLSPDGRTLYVSLPDAGTVAVVDARNWTVTRRIPVEGARNLSLAASGSTLWSSSANGAVAIDTASLEVSARFDLGGPARPVVGAGKVLLLAARTARLVDTADTSAVQTLEVGGRAAAWSPLSQSFFTADPARAGIHVIAEHDGSVREVEAAAGLVSLVASPDGRWIAAPNPPAGQVLFLDTSDNSIRHRVEIADEPDQVAFTTEFAYVRALGSERVSMLRLADLAGAAPVSTTEIPAGSRVPGDAPVRPAGAPAIAPAAMPGAMLFANPAEEAVWLHMEGMNAPMGSLAVARHNPRAVLAVGYGLREVEPGIHSATVTLPRHGDYELALRLDSPAVAECLPVAVAPDPAGRKRLALEHLGGERVLPVGQTADIRFRLSGPANAGEAKDVQLMAILLPGTRQTRVAAEPLGKGEYSAKLALPEAGRWQLLVEAPSLRVGYHQLPWRILDAVEEPKNETP